MEVTGMAVALNHQPSPQIRIPGPHVNSEEIYGFIKHSRPHIHSLLRHKLQDGWADQT